MSRLIKASIDVTKIKKEHLFKGEKGTYANIDIWINDEEDQYGNIASIAQSFKVGGNFDKVYIGNGKDLKKQTEPSNNQSIDNAEETDDIPF